MRRPDNMVNYECLKNVDPIEDAHKFCYQKDLLLCFLNLGTDLTVDQVAKLLDVTEDYINEVMNEAELECILILLEQLHSPKRVAQILHADLEFVEEVNLSRMEE
jgi:hypothetical protein